MRTHGLVVLTAIVGLTTLGIVACSDDGELGGAPPPSTSSGTSGTSGTSGGNDTDGGSSSGDPANRPQETVEGEITASRTLSADKTWLLKGLVSVKPGATLTIEKGTVIKGDNASKAILLIEAGAKIDAVGTPDEPIVFTSQAAEGQKAAGDWGGVIILGNAPINVKDANGNPIQQSIEGILAAGVGTNSKYGGDKPDESSGRLQYIRIEYSGVVIGDNNEVNGLTFGGVGRGTVVDHIQIRQTLDDCFEFFGGTVDAKYLACQHNEDDGFDFDLGYTGRLQFLVLQQDPTHEGDDNGFESDNDAQGTGALPLTAPTVYNATVCGKNVSLAKEQYGLLLRKNTRGTYRNLVVSGFQAALDIRDGIGAPGELTIANSVFFNSKGAGSYVVTDHIAFVENGSTAGQPDRDDDNGLDEVAWFKGQAGNAWTDPGVTGCFNASAPVFGPTASLTEGAATPPNDGFFDTTASYKGAFKDANDKWATTGKWVVWADK
ncbi:MAG: hypothetical protein KF764_19590 [Labilithrix sp.]|nr:hypothetical protein [Labilithrix sp.]MBX3222681.1 hypothetical protein [Labilithrix sp.]